jgi:transcription antitermination factor NusG
MEQYFVLHTETQREHVAAVGVAKAGLGVLLPMHTTFKRKGGCFVPDRTTVLFPRWIFVTIDLERDKALIGGLNRLRGASRVQKGKPSVLLCGASDRPHPVPQAAMDIIINRERERLDNMEAKPFVSPLSPGVRVKVVGGPFTGFEAAIQSNTPHERVWALLEIFGRQTPVQLDVEDIRVAG